MSQVVDPYDVSQRVDASASTKLILRVHRLLFVAWAAICLSVAVYGAWPAASSLVLGPFRAFGSVANDYFGIPGGLPNITLGVYGSFRALAVVATAVFTITHVYIGLTAKTKQPRAGAALLLRFIALSVVASCATVAAYAAADLVLATKIAFDVPAQSGPALTPMNFAFATFLCTQSGGVLMLALVLWKFTFTVGAELKRTHGSSA